MRKANHYGNQPYLGNFFHEFTTKWRTYFNIKFSSILTCFSQYNTVNQGLATLAFFGVGVNLVLFLTRVLQQNNADAANSVSKWTGTVYIFSLVGAFLSDSYWGRYKTCAIFQIIFVIVSTVLNLKDFGLTNGNMFFLFDCFLLTFLYYRAWFRFP